jgi:uncharacterized membrane protein
VDMEGPHGCQVEESAASSLTTCCKRVRASGDAEAMTPSKASRATLSDPPACHGNPNTGIRPGSERDHEAHFECTTPLASTCTRQGPTAETAKQRAVEMRGMSPTRRSVAAVIGSPTLNAQSVSPDVNRHRDSHADDSNHVYQNLIDLVFPKYESEWLACYDLHCKIDALDSERRKVAHAMKKCHQSFSLSDRTDIMTTAAKPAADKVRELPPRMEIPPLVEEDRNCWAKIGAFVDAALQETTILQARKLVLQKDIDRRRATLTSLKSDIEIWKANCRRSMEAILNKANDDIQN